MAGFKKGIKQGIYKPVNENKWIITKTFDMKEPCIKYRSSWERHFCVFADMNDNIVKVNSEGTKIKYSNPITNKISNYYMDFTMETKDGVVWLVEIKPKAQCEPPKPPKNNTEKSNIIYQNAIKTYIINQAKWEAAQEYCDINGWKFIIINETHLF